MIEVVHEYADVLRAGGTHYTARAYGNIEENGAWGGYLVFLPAGGGRVVATDRETTQSTLDALTKWAHTLSWVYLEGALTRALERQPEVQVARRLAEIEAIEADARAEAEELERAAVRARADAEAAREEREAAEHALAEAGVRSAEASAEFHDQAAAEARADAEAASGARLVYEHALARAEEESAGRIAEAHEEAAVRARGEADKARRRAGKTRRKR